MIESLVYRRNPSAYHLYAKHRKPVDTPFGERTVLISGEWSAMSVEEKAPFVLDSANTKKNRSERIKNLPIRLKRIYRTLRKQKRAKGATHRRPPMGGGFIKFMNRSWEDEKRRPHARVYTAVRLDAIRAWGALTVSEKRVYNI